MHQDLSHIAGLVGLFVGDECDRFELDLARRRLLAPAHPAGDLALVYSPLLPVPFREFLLERGMSLVEVPTAEFESMGCNVLAVAPRVCVMLEGNPETRRQLEEAGVEVHTYSGEEISAPGEGGPTCLTRPLFRNL